MNAAEPILAYLQGQMPTYPFDPRLDAEFVDELLADFQDLDILEEAKTFRWYYHNRPGDRAPEGMDQDVGVKIQHPTAGPWSGGRRAPEFCLRDSR